MKEPKGTFTIFNLTPVETTWEACGRIIRKLITDGKSVLFIKSSARKLTHL